MRLLTLGIVAMAFVVASCDTTQSPTQASPGTDNALGKTYSSKYHNAGRIYNPCCNDTMDFEADIHQTFSDETDKNGVRTIKVQSNSSKVVLTGRNSGIKYVASEKVNENVVWQPSGCPVVRTWVQTLRVVATGSGQGKNNCSFVLKVTFKEMLDDDCNYSVVVDDMTIECA